MRNRQGMAWRGAKRGLGWMIDLTKHSTWTLETIAHFLGSIPQVSNTRPAGRFRPVALFYVAPGGFKDTWSPFLKEIEEIYPVLLFWRLRSKWIYVVILEKYSYVWYFYTQINNDQMQRESFNTMFEEFINCFRPFKRAAMMLIWPTVNMSLRPLFNTIHQWVMFPDLVLQSNNIRPVAESRQQNKREDLCFIQHIHLSC